MKGPVRFLLLVLLFIPFWEVAAQKKMQYRPCYLLDSVDARLDFIKKNAARIFDDTSDCKQELLDGIAANYISKKDVKYLAALSSIRQNPLAKVEDLYTDLIQRMMQDDFSGFLHQLYLSRGVYAPLEKEMVAAMNMIVNDRPLKQKYMGLLNVEISKAHDNKDLNKENYLKKLRLKIEEEKMR